MKHLLLIVLLVGSFAQAQQIIETSKIDKVEITDSGVVQIRLVKQVMKGSNPLGNPWFHRYACDKDFAKTDFPNDIKEICKEMLANTELKKKLFKK